MKITKRIALLLLTALVLTLLCGCTTFDNFREAFLDKPVNKDVTIEIGIYEPITGVDSDSAELEIQGIELANDVYPNINGKIVKLIYSDNGSDIYAAETAIKNLISKKPDVILGSYGSVYSLVAGEYINDAQIPTISMTNTNPLVTKNYDYYFRVCYVDSNQGDLLAKYVLEEKKEKTAGVLLPEDDDAALAMTTTFTDRIKAQTENEDAITVYETYKTGQTDYTDLLNTVKESGVKSVLLPGDINDSAKIVKQAYNMGLDVTFLGDRDWATDDFKKLVGGAGNEKTVAFVNFFSSDQTGEETTKFLEAYKEKYGSGTPEDSVALGYDAYLIAIDAINKAGDDAAGEDIMKVLSQQSEFQGASGTITFNNFGDPIKTAYICTWAGNELSSLYTIDPT